MREAELTCRRRGSACEEIESGGERAKRPRERGAEEIRAEPGRLGEARPVPVKHFLVRGFAGVFASKIIQETILVLTVSAPDFDV